MSDAGDFELIEPRGKSASPPAAAKSSAPAANDFELVKPEDLELANQTGIVGRVVQPGIDALKGYAGGVAAPIINFADYPARAIAANLIGLGASPLKTGALPVDAKSREEFYKARQRALDATELPETSFGRAISGALSLPGEVVSGAANWLSRKTLGPETTAAIGPYATMAADAANIPLAAAGARFGAGRRAGSASTEDVAGAKIENRARKQLSQSFETGLYEGGPSALDFVEERQKARAAGQPYALLDANNPELQGRVGTIYRQGGGGQGIVKNFLETRHDEQVPRAQRIISEGLGDPSIFTETADVLRERRSANAKPLFDAAAQGPGLKVFEQEFTSGLQEAGRLEAEAQQRVVQADAALTQARARESQAGNVYSSSAANTAGRDAETALAAARGDLQAAQAHKAGMSDLMQRARADGSAGRPDATWSPYLQMLLDTDPDIQRGIRRGWKLERREAHGKGEQPNPRDYAIVGMDGSKPVIAAVPNMRLWMVAKEGLDAAIDSRIKKKGGEVDKEARSLIILRDGLTTELDRLNPQYKVARDQWAGDSASRTALLRGEKLFDLKAFPTDAHVAEYLGTLSTADRELVKLGLGQKLLTEVRRAPDAADKAKRVVNTDIARTRLEMLLGPEAERFLESVEREADMEKSRQAISKGSQTRERAAADEKYKERTFHALGGMFVNPIRHPIEASRAVGRLYRALRNQPDMKVNEAAARIATDPNVVINTDAGKAILPKNPVPYRSWLTGPRAGVGAELTMPREDDPLARAIGR